MARPPGTQLKKNSLLSGGQQTMTAVALLVSIYQVQPSPFCILDELADPLDDSWSGSGSTGPAQNASDRPTTNANSSATSIRRLNLRMICHLCRALSPGRHCPGQTLGAYGSCPRHRGKDQAQRKIRATRLRCSSLANGTGPAPAGLSGSARGPGEAGMRETHPANRRRCLTQAGKSSSSSRQPSSQPPRLPSSV